jgi:DNA invertase Pin-like site-specific DNA recombinase
METGKSAIIYCRVSSQDQLSGTSLETQERICREYCDRSGYIIREVFFERGESAKTADRTELKRALLACTKGKKKIDLFVVYKLDRFSRNTEDHVTVSALLRRAGTTLASATEPIDASPTGKLMEAMLAGIAEFDNSVRTERTKAGMLERLRQGVWVWPAPTGYYRPHRGSNLVPHPDEAAVVRAVFQFHAAGVHTYAATAEHLAARGLRLRSGRAASHQTVEKILHNPIYTGVMEAFGQRWAGSFPPIIPPALFKRCQPGSDEVRAHSSPRSLNNPLFPLRRLVVCSRCGEPLTGSSTTGRQGKRYPYYHHRSQRCTAAFYLRKSEFENLFVAELREIAPQKGAAGGFCEVMRDLMREDERGKDGQRARLQSQIVALDREREEVFRLHRSGVYTDEDFREQKRLLDLKKHEKSRLFEEAAGMVGNLDVALARIRERFEDVAGTWMRLEPSYSERLRFQRLIFSKAVPFDGEAFGTAETTCIYSAIRGFDGDKNCLVAHCRAVWHRLLDELRRWR